MHATGLTVISDPSSFALVVVKNTSPESVDRDLCRYGTASFGRVGCWSRGRRSGGNVGRHTT